MSVEIKSMPKGQEERLRKLARGGPLQRWALNQLSKFGVVTTEKEPAKAPDAEPTSPTTPPEPISAPMTPQEPKRAGKYGNCHDCGQPIDKITKRQPFHHGNNRESIVHVCLPCANIRWSNRK